MIQQDILFSILRFAALLAPAIAILMQLLEGTDENKSPSFRFLEVSFILIIIGTLVVIYQILVSIESTATQFATALIAGSLIFIAAGIGWRAVPGTENISPNIDTIGDLRKLAKLLIGRPIIFSLPTIVAYLIFILLNESVGTYSNIGYISLTNDISSSDFFAIFLFLIAVRTTVYLINTGHFYKHSFFEGVFEATIGTLLFFLVIAVFVAPAFILAYPVHFVSNLIIDISMSNILFTLPHLWAILIALVMFITEVWGESEDDTRLAKNL
jgi:hypothetical protein